MKHFFVINFRRFVPFLTVIAAFVAYACWGLTHKLDIDEREHAQSVLLVFSGKVPYRDFFQHHNPLMWYLFAPIHLFLGDTPYIWHILRAISLFIGACSAFAVYKISFLITPVKKTALFCAALWLSFRVVRWSGSEFRPDNLMMLFYLIGFYEILLYLKKKQNIFLYKAFVWFWLSFAVLQKVVVLLLPLLIELVRNVRAKTLGKAVFAPIVLTLCAVSWLYKVGALTDYLTSNWLLNSKMDISHPYLMPPAGLYLMPLFALVAALYQLAKGAKALPKMTARLTVNTILLGLFILPTAKMMLLWQQYFLLFMPYVALVITQVICRLLAYRRSIRVLSAVFFCILIFQSVHAFSHYHNAETTLKTAQQQTAHIINNSSPDDLIICNAEYHIIEANRLCLSGYYWFSYKHMSPRHRYYCKPREKLDLNNTVKARLPKIIPDKGLNDCIYNPVAKRSVCARQELDKERLAAHYDKKENLYVRR